VSGIALSKILEVYDKMKASKIKKMTTIPQLMATISPESDLMRGLMKLTLDHDEEEQITKVVQKAIDSNSSPPSLYPSLKEFMDDYVPDGKYEKAKELTTELFPDDNSVEYFVLTPVPDDNSPEEFASSTDLLVLRWPSEGIKPWESDGEHVLDIDEFNTKKE
jgi:hypothetical protein